MTTGHPLPQDPEPTLTIAEVAERTGLSHDTLRYYEKAGLIERVGRTTGNQRRYEAADLLWLEFLLRLRDTGMPISGMQRYARLRAQGDASVADRLAMLREHRAELADRMRALRRNARALDAKIAHYERLLDGQPGTEDPT
ncbi:MerR family transcriptional regulator [Streptomyces sp. MAI_2237]